VLDGEEDGLALPAAWDVPGTVEFGMTHITGGSWTTWTAAVAFAESYLRDLGVLSFLPAELSARAERVRAAFAGYQGALAERFTAIPTRAAQAQPVVPVAVGG
jgi:hypothetical protein